MLGFSVATHGGAIGAHIDINPEMSQCSGGFIALSHLLSVHYQKPECYLAMVALLFRQPLSDMIFDNDFSLDIIWSKVFGLSPSRFLYMTFVFRGRKKKIGGQSS